MVANRILYVLFFSSLLIITVIPKVSCQNYVPGVVPGDWFNYELNYTYNYHPNIDSLPFYEAAAEAEWNRITITSVFEERISYYVTHHFENGTESNLCEVYFNISSGISHFVEAGTHAFLFVAANLTSSDTIYPNSANPLLFTFNGSYSQTYPEGERQINYIEFSNTYEGITMSGEMHFDQEFGTLTYLYAREYDNSEDYLVRETTMILVDSNKVVIPEFSSWIILTLFLMVPLAVIFYKRRN